MSVKENILDRVQEHKKYVEKEYGKENLFFTALQGSQNYNLDDDFSDIDTKSLLLPTLDSFIYARKEPSYTLILPNNEHADVKDFRDMFDIFRKQNINFVEILFSPYACVNKDWEWFYSALTSKAEEIAHYNRYTTLESMLGHLHLKAKKFYDKTVTTESIVNKHGYDPKQLHHMVRIQDFLIRYVKDEPYRNILEKPSDIDYIKGVKRGYYSLKEAEKIRDTILFWARDFEDRWSQKLVNENDPAVEKFLNELQRDICVKRMREVSLNYYAS